jgi:beta-N-acetylhexosaminidase
LLALIAGVAVGAGGESAKTRPTVAATEPPVHALREARTLSLERQVGQALMISFRGTTPPAYVRRALRRGRASGVILFRANVPTPAVTRSLARRLQRAARGRALIAADQEGGPIRRLGWAAPQPAQSDVPTPFAAKRHARAAAKDLAAVGVNVTLAPVADVAGSGSVMKTRAFPGGATDVTALTRAAIQGYRGTKVAATLKHFPGLGQARTNTDNAAVTISSPRAALEARDLPPFEAGIEAGAPLVMASHALFTGLDRANIASQSRPILTKLLRETLGFKGVVITDSMEAAAVRKRSPIELASLRAIAAGADLVLLTDDRSFPRVYDRLLTRARRSAKFRARIADAAARVIALKQSLGLPGP